MEDEALEPLPESLEFGPSLRKLFESRLDAFAVAPIPLLENRPAAVAICLSADRDGQTSFLLTRRAARLKNHGGQWSLPGGRLEAGETPEQAALRELEEELGVPQAQSKPLGRLDDFRTRSGFVMTPIVTWADEELVLKPDPGEVAAAYRIPLADLNHPEAPILTEIPESEMPVLSMPLLNQKIHAPTAAILYQVLEVLVRGRSTRVAHYEQPVFAWK